MYIDNTVIASLLTVAATLVIGVVIGGIAIKGALQQDTPQKSTDENKDAQ